MKKEIVAIKSADGNYFEIGKNEFGYYLKNNYTDIPNEFNMYSLETVKKMFLDLCERVPDCAKVSIPSGHKNSCMLVEYSDKTEQLFQEQKGIEMNLCAYTAKTAEYVEFYADQFFSWHSSSLITLAHLRQVCREKSEDYTVFLTAIRDVIEDDGIDIRENILTDGTIEIHRIVLGHDYGTFISIMPSGKIEKTGNLKFVELMKKHDVSVYRSRA